MVVVISDTTTTRGRNVYCLSIRRKREVGRERMGIGKTNGELQRGAYHLKEQRLSLLPFHLMLQLHAFDAVVAVVVVGVVLVTNYLEHQREVTK